MRRSSLRASTRQGRPPSEVRDSVYLTGPSPSGATSVKSGVSLGSSGTSLNEDLYIKRCENVSIALAKLVGPN